MALEMGCWRADGDKLMRLTPTPIGVESQLATYTESNPSILGQTILIIGRQGRHPGEGFAGFGLDD